MAGTITNKATTLCEVISLDDMDASMEASFLAELPKDGGALAALERLDTPPPTPIFLSELEGSPLSSAGLESPLADSELESSGADQDTMTMDDLLSSCGVSCDAAVDSPLLSSLDLMWGASAAPAPAAAPSPASAPTPAPAPEPAAAAPTDEAEPPEPPPPTPEQQLQAEVQKLHKQQQEEEKQQLLEKQVQKLQKEQLLQQRQDQQQRRLQQHQLIRQQKQQQRQQQRQKQQLQWQQQQLQHRQAKLQHQQKLQQQQCQQREESGARSSAPSGSNSHRGPTKIRRKTRVITIPSTAGAGTVTVPHIVICTPSVINSRPAATSLPVTFSVQDRQTAAARVACRPGISFSSRHQSLPLGVGVGVRRRVVGRAASSSSASAASLAKRHSVESAPSSPETAPSALLRIPTRKPVLKVTTATQTGEAVDEVLRNNDSTLIRLLVTGQDLTNGYKLCPNGQCLTPERQPAPPSLFAGLPDRGSSVLLSMLSHDDEPQLPALFPSETARLLDDQL